MGTQQHPANISARNEQKKPPFFLQQISCTEVVFGVEQQDGACELSVSLNTILTP